eukprot:12351494-Alexandrium_andersonii.AAC.1
MCIRDRRDRAPALVSRVHSVSLFVVSGVRCVLIVRCVWAVRGLFAGVGVRTSSPMTLCPVLIVSGCVQRPAGVFGRVRE